MTELNTIRSNKIYKYRCKYYRAREAKERLLNMHSEQSVRNAVASVLDPATRRERREDWWVFTSLQVCFSGKNSAD